MDDAKRIVRNALNACSLPTPDQETAGEHAPDISLAAKFDELGFDSLAFMEFCIAVFCDTGVELTVEQASAMGSPQAVVEFLERAQ